MDNQNSAFGQAFDPADVVDFYIYLNQGAADAQVAPLLLPGEAVKKYRLALTKQAKDAGVIIPMAGDYAPVLAGNELRLWLMVEQDRQNDPIFDGNGLLVGIVLTVTTTAAPPRTKQRTFYVRAMNQ